nr:putative transporter [Quercus suber]
MRFGKSESKASPTSSLENTTAYSQNYPGATNYDQASPSYDDDLHVQCPSHTTERRLVTRIDWHVIPWLCVMYLLAFLDRVNISNANIFGLSTDLALDHDKFNIALVRFSKHHFRTVIRPHPDFSITGIVKSYSGLLATRFFLGVFETGMFPGAFYLIGMWYRRSEAQKRYSFFFSSTTLAGAFGGLLAAAIGKMDGVANYAGWRWIFILEGCLTVAVAFVFFFALPDFPEESKWLQEDEKAYLAARLRADQGKSARERKITLTDVGNVFKDYKVIVAGFMYFGLIVPAYSYAYFAPGIIQSYGYGRIETQLHSVPPWAAAFAFAMILAALSDKTQHRFGFAVFAICVSIAGFGILIAVHDNTPLQYGALFLVTMGTYGAMPLIVCWFNMNLGGHHRRAVGTAWQIGFGNIGGIIAVFAFLPDDMPRYVPGYSICIAFAVLSMLSCVVYGVACIVANRNKQRATVDVGLTEYEKTELGDQSPEYRGDAGTRAGDVDPGSSRSTLDRKRRDAN